MPTDIQGLSILFDASISDFKKQLKAFDKDLRSTESQLKATQQSLELEFDSSQLIKAQELARDAIKKTEERADILRKRLEHMEQVGVTDKTRAEYNKLQTDLQYTENKAVKLQKQLEDLNKTKLDKLAKDVDKVGQALTKAGQAMAPVSIAAGAAIGSLGAGINSAIEYGDQLATVSTQLGITAEKYQELLYISQQTDVETEKLTQAFAKVRLALGDHLQGNITNATKVLDELGLSINNLDGTAKSSEQMFDEVLIAIANVEDSTLQANYANKIYGEEMATKLLPMLKLGANGLRVLNEEFEAMPKLTDEEVAKLAELDGVLDSLKLQFSIITNQIAIEFLPVVEKIATFMNDKVKPALEGLREWLKGLSDGQKTAMVAALGIVTALTPLLLISGAMIGSVGNLVKVFGKLSPALKGMLGPIGLIVGVIALLYATNEDFREALNELIGTLITSLKPVFDALVGLIKQVFELLMPIINIIATLLVPILNLLTPILGFVVKVIAEIIAVVIKLITWVAKLGEGFLNFVLKVLKPVINALEWLWDLFKKILGLDDKKKLEVDVGYNDPGFNPQGSTITSGLQNQEYLKGMVASNSNAISNITNNTTVDRSNKNVTLNLTVNNYSEPVDPKQLVKMVNRELAKGY
jgi:hypothetical protein